MPRITSKQQNSPKSEKPQPFTVTPLDTAKKQELYSGIISMFKEPDTFESLQENRQNKHTPFLLCLEIIKRMDIRPGKKILVISALEFIPVLIDQFGIDKDDIFFLDEGRNDGKIKTIKMAVLIRRLAFHPDQILSIEGAKKMKFDYVVGNPPFNVDKEEIAGTRGKQLFAEFTKLSMKISNNVVMVLPALWTHKKNKFRTDVVDYGLVTIMNTSEHFSIGLPTCAVILSKDFSGETEVITSEGSFKKKIDANYNIHLSGGNQIDDIIDTLKGKFGDFTFADLWARSNIYNNDSCVGTGEKQFLTLIDTKTQELQFSTIPADVPTPFEDKWRVVCNLNLGRNELGVLKIIPPGIATSYSIISFVAEDEQHAKHLEHVLSCVVSRFLISKVKNTVSKNKNLFGMLPVPELGQSLDVAFTTDMVEGMNNNIQIRSI